MVSLVHVFIQLVLCLIKQGKSSFVCSLQGLPQLIGTFSLATVIFDALIFDTRVALTQLSYPGCPFDFIYMRFLLNFSF